MDKLQINSKFVILCDKIVSEQEIEGKAGKGSLRSSIMCKWLVQSLTAWRRPAGAGGGASGDAEPLMDSGKDSAAAQESTSASIDESNPTPQGDAFRRWGTWVLLGPWGWSPHEGDQCSYKRPHREVSPLLHVRPQREAS